VEYDPLLHDGSEYASQAICMGDQASIEVNILPDSKYYLHSVGGGNFDEMQEITSPLFAITSEGEYYIEVKKHSCSISSNTFQISYMVDSLFIPNVVTDNNDLINDKFEIYLENASTLSLTIYDRYGNRLFHNDDYDASWPDKQHPPGTYFYECYFSSVCNSDKSMAKGWVQLLR
jgi:gliding motility-associated-like protein